MDWYRIETQGLRASRDEVTGNKADDYERRPPGTAGMWEGVRYQIYESADGHVLFMASEQEFWKNFCEGIGRADLFERWPGSKFGDHAKGNTELARRRGPRRAGGLSGRVTVPGRVELSFASRLRAPAAEVWGHASSMAGVNAELAPWIRMTHPDGAADLASSEVPIGRLAFRSWLLAFGVVPIDRHALTLAEVDQRGGGGGAFVEESSSWLQRRWRHERDVSAAAEGSVVVDRLVVEPRLPVGFVVRHVVGALFRHRHRRLVDRFGQSPVTPPVRSPRDEPGSVTAATQGEPTMSDEGVRGDRRWGTIPGLLRSAADVHGDREAVVDRSADPVVRLSFDGLRERADALASALVDAGIGTGDRVAIWAPNCWEWVVALLGIQSAGAVLVPLNTRYKGSKRRRSCGGAGRACSSPSRASSATTTCRCCVVPTSMICRTSSGSSCCATPVSAPTGSSRAPSCSPGRRRRCARGSPPSTAIAAASTATRVRPALHLRHDGPPEGRRDHPRADVARVRDWADSWACAKATAT
jgi:ligand-binding SRPBCC domain-containing protein